MRAPVRVLAVGLALAGLGGCGLIQPKSIIANRYASAVGLSATSPRVGLVVSTTAAKDAEAAGVAITALGDRAQAALIAANKGAPPTELKPADEGGESRVATRGTLKRHVVIAVRPEGFLAPGDRIDAVRISLAVAAAQRRDWKIASWTQATNGKTPIEIGKITQTAEQKVTAETGLAVTKVLPDAKLGYEASRSNSQEGAVTDTTRFNAGVMEDGTAWLDEVGGWREDLAHNLDIDLVLAAGADRLTVTKFVMASALAKPGSSPPAPAEAKSVSLAQLDVYGRGKSTEVVCGQASLSYRVRHIGSAKAAATFTESDDDASFSIDQSETTFVLAPPPLEPIYGIYTGEAGDTPLIYEMRGVSSTLTFRTLKEAAAFADWLYDARAAKGVLANARIGVSDGGQFTRLSATQWDQLTPGLLNQEPLEAARLSLLKGCPASIPAAPAPKSPG